MVPLEYQEKIRNLILEKAEYRIEKEIKQLKEVAKMEMDIMNGTFNRHDYKH
jgi:hypothetical protein